LGRRARRQFLESSTLFVNILRWSLLAAVVGAIVGFSTAIFIMALHGSIEFMQRLPYYFVAAPLGLWASAMLVRFLAPQARGHGTEKVIEAVHQREGRMYPVDAPVKLVATVITIASGGSAGKEGPAAQIGATLASSFASLLRLSAQDRKRLVICGISAGFASIFGTPVAGALFGVEVLFLGQILYEVLLPSFIAGITAYQVSNLLGAEYFWETMRWTPVFSEGLLLRVILSGAFFGLVAILFIEALSWGGRLFRSFGPRPHFIPLYAGMILAGFGLLGADQGLGLGAELLQESVSGGPSPGWLWIFKSMATGITLGGGGSGGVITPIFVVGANAGALFGRVMSLDPSIFAALGMVAVLSGCANTPIAASVMGLEIFGPDFGPYGATACVISFLMTGYRSVYSTQVLARQKSDILVAPPLNEPISSSGRTTIDYSHQRGWARMQHLAREFGRWLQGARFWK